MFPVFPLIDSIQEAKRSDDSPGAEPGAAARKALFELLSNGSNQHVTRIDSHHHLWIYDPVEYSWIDDGMSALRRDFLVEDLEAAIQETGIEAVVTVQAHQSLDETEWLLGLASRSDLIVGVVGWAPLIAPDVESKLERIGENAKLKAVRHILQGETEPGFMLREDFQRGLGLLPEFDLAYDILILESQLSEAVRLVDRHPNLRFILDHIAKPRIRTNELEPWRTRIFELARRPNVYCKLSGLVTEADYDDWSRHQLLPYLDSTLEAFGPSRLMFGSDWPVCLAACGYEEWVGIVEEFVGSLSADERSRIWHGTAVEAYELQSVDGGPSREGPK